MEEVIAMRFEGEDKELIRGKARELGLDMASFCRSLVLKTIKEKQKDV